MNVIFTPAQGGKTFVGIKFTDNDIHIHYPETFRWNFIADGAVPVTSLDDDITLGIRSIISSIEYAKTHSGEKTLQNDTSDANEAFALKSYIWIIQDFMNNGLYKNRENVFKVNQKGKIDWKRTLSKIPLYSEGNFVYKDFVVSTKSQLDNMLVDIYRFCVLKSIFLAGWLYGIRSSSFGVKKISEVLLSDAMQKRYIYAIRNELAKTFDDEKRLRLSHMLNVIQGLNKSTGGQLVYGVDSFDYVFECAVNRVLGTAKEKTAFSPYGEWSNGTKSSPLRPDSIFINGSTYIIIDSKCYRYAATGYQFENCDGLPATDSIQKQITYGDYLQKILMLKGEPSKIYNCFVVPYNKTVNYGKKSRTDEFLCYSGLYATANWRENLREYEKIYVLLIDMRDVLEKMREYDHSLEHEMLLKLVDKI
jgi:hypothetical protein